LKHKSSLHKKRKEKELSTHAQIPSEEKEKKIKRKKELNKKRR